MLNEVLQNPDEIHEEYIEKNIRMWGEIFGWKRTNKQLSRSAI
jgi:hypothetical protein